MNDPHLNVGRNSTLYNALSSHASIRLVSVFISRFSRKNA